MSENHSDSKSFPRILTKESIISAPQLGVIRAAHSRLIFDEKAPSPIIAKDAVLLPKEVTYLASASVAYPDDPERFTLPEPYQSSKERFLPQNYITSDLFWDAIIDAAVHDGNVYIFTGVFEIFTAGHLSVLNEIINHMQQDREENKRTYCAVLVENEQYINQWKKRKQVVPTIMRAGWFEKFAKFGVFTGSWPSYYKNGNFAHWNLNLDPFFANVYGISPLLTIPQKQRQNVVFVLTEFPESESRKEDLALTKQREEKLAKVGFSVIKIRSELSDISTTELLKKFTNIQEYTDRQFTDQDL